MSIISNSEKSLDENDFLRQGFDYAREQDLDVGDEDLEALGAARYVEQIITGERDDYSLDDLVEYMATADDFNFEEFQEYKGEMANDYTIFGDKVVEKLQDLEESRNRYQAQGHLFQALYEEVRQERDSAAKALETILGYDFEDESPQEPRMNSPFNLNMGNQILSERPPRNWNIGNQIILNEWGRIQSSTDESSDMKDENYDEWEDDDAWNSDWI